MAAPRQALIATIGPNLRALPFESGRPILGRRAHEVKLRHVGRPDRIDVDLYVIDALHIHVADQ